MRLGSANPFSEANAIPVDATIAAMSLARFSTSPILGLIVSYAIPLEARVGNI